MCELNWKSVNAVKDMVDVLRAALEKSVECGREKPMSLCKGVLDRLLRDQLPVESNDDKKEDKGDTPFLLWCLGDENQRDYSNLPLLISWLNHTR